MKLDNNINISPKSLKHIMTIGGVVSAIIVAYYMTGLYRNYLQIKKLKDEKSKPLKPEDL